MLARRLDRTANPFGELRPLVGPFPLPIARLSGAETLLEEASQSLPDGAARAEAVAIRLRRAGIEVAWGAPDVVADTASLLRLSRARGESSVEIARADPSLLPEMQLGAFFNAYWRRRTLRHVLCRLAPARAINRTPAPAVALATDVAFWTGVRSAASTQEWERWTRSSYVAFYYHRIGDGQTRGQEHLDLQPRRFERHLRLLRLLRYQPLTPDELLEFHANPESPPLRRRFVLTADDGLRDAVAALQQHAHLRPHVYVNSAAVGGSPWWAFGNDVADWDELLEFEAAGGVVASHCRSHPKLPTLDVDAIREELAGSLSELRGRLRRVPPLLAYPHGHHDERVRAEAAAAGYRAAFGTQPGRNGAGIDPYCLRRVAIKDWDGIAALLWKTFAGEMLPRPWERLRARLRTASASQSFDSG
jgi:peptidoglycan/xylan/chitin deacetylase (PgdA/CDA1 family)